MTHSNPNATFKRTQLGIQFQKRKMTRATNIFIQRTQSGKSPSIEQEYREEQARRGKIARVIAHFVKLMNRYLNE